MNENLKAPEVRNLSIESISLKGDGITSLDNKKVLVPFALKGEKVAAEITVEKSGYFEAKLIEVLESSVTRETPPCKHFYRCGGCHLQHMNPDYYKEFKSEIFNAALTRAGFKTDQSEIIIIGQNSRRRAVLKVAVDNSEVKLGFYENNSHNVINIEECYVLEPEIFSQASHLKKALGSLSSPEKITDIMIMAADSGLDFLFYAKYSANSKDKEILAAFAKENNIQRISWKSGDVISPVIILNQPLMHFGKASVELPPESFLQPTRRGQGEITARVLAGVKGHKEIIDLFSGSGTYSFAMAEKARVHGVEMGSAMVSAGKKAAQLSKAKVTFEERNLDKNPVSVLELSKFTACVINPPRTGAFAQSKMLAKSKIAKIVMVSCSPDTFSRDARILKEGGYNLTNAIAIDQFHYTPHLEIVAEFER